MKCKGEIIVNELNVKAKRLGTISVPTIMKNKTLLKCIKRAVDGKFNSTTVTEGRYKVDMHYDGYGVSISAYCNECHFLDWDSLKKEVVYFRKDDKTLNLVAKFINAITALGYEVTNIRNEYYPVHSFNWSDFVSEKTV